VIRRAAALVLGALLVLAFVGLRGGVRAASGSDRVVYAIEAPTAEIVEAVAAQAAVDVRWVEPGLVLLECAPGIALPAAWGARVVTTRSDDIQLGILRAPEIQRWSKSGNGDPDLVRFLDAARVAEIETGPGPMWVLQSRPGTWPVELLGCHGGLVLPPHGYDPRSLIDAGPPAALRPYLRSPGTPLGPGPRRVVAAVSEDSVRAHLEQLALDFMGRPADRYVFHSALDAFYAERVLATMQRAVVGVTGATVGRQAFPMRRTLADTVNTFNAFNLVARIPGTTPGLGTWVVGAHVDATGSRHAAWVDSIKAGAPTETPGAEDNATGVACVLELLRCVADGIRTGSVEFPFDLEFVAFSGEEVPVLPSPEQGLVGSTSFVSSALAAGTQLLGCYNFDMVGYDSIPGYLQITYNPSSRWLADWVRDAATEVVPATPLNVTTVLDPQRISDHNSFWVVNAPAIHAADGSIDDQRHYETYHRPTDEIGRVDMVKVTEVARVMLAALVRFDTRDQTSPLLAFDREDLQVWRTIDNIDYVYVPRFHRLYPGVPLQATLAVHSLAARYTAPLHVHLETSGSGGTDVFYDSVTAVDLPAGDRYDLRIGIPVRGSDLGWRRLAASVTYTDSLGSDVVQTQIDSFFVDVNQQSALAVTIKPNPVRGALSDANLTFALDVPGDLVVDVYDLEGQRVASSTRSVIPLVTKSEITLPLLPAGTAGSSVGASLASGPYVARVVLRSSTGQTTSAHVPIALLR
jgi:Peptidase family M28